MTQPDDMTHPHDMKHPDAMTHPDEEKLLGFVLETLDQTGGSTVREHLLSCSRCNETERRLRDDLARIKDIDIRVEIPSPPRLVRNERFLPALLKMAAVLAVGFLIGYMTAILSAPDRPIVVQQRLIPAPGVTSSRGYVTCPAVDVMPARNSRGSVQ